MWYIEDTEHEGKRLSWATTTRSLRRLKARIVKVGGKRDQPSPRNKHGNLQMHHNGSSCSEELKCFGTLQTSTITEY
jgi:hypothetical protein